MPARSDSKAAANEIKVLLTRRGLHQTELAVGTGIKIHKLRRRMQGEVSFSVDDLAAIASFLSVPVAALLAEAA